MAVTSSNNLKQGSKGNDVLELQKLLNKNGNYGLAEDGSFGSKTLAAVKDYQQKNGLAVDGIVGTKTWGTLNSASTTAPSNTTTPSPTQTNNSFEYKKLEYADPKDSDIVKQAESMLQQHMANKPGQTQSAWTDTLNETLNKILNKEEFSYDLNGDALYQQYKDQYTTQGQMAMMDTMGQAQAMTGGYGNSYAQSVGQQTYQGYLQQLNDKVPELYQLALNQYNQEKEDLYNQASLASAMEQKDYDRGRDAVSDYYTELQYLTNNADKLYDREIAERDFAAGLWADEQKYGFDIHQSDKSDANTMAMTMLGMGLMPDAEKLAMAGISSAEAQAIVNKVKEQEKAALNGGGGGGNGYNNGGQTASDIKKMQAALGITADGKWGPASIKASGGLTADEAYTAWQNGTLGEGVVGDVDGGISEDIIKKAESFTSNTELASYLSGLANTGVITEDQKNQLLAKYTDDNEKYTYDGNGSITGYSYSDMVKSGKGWKVLDDGGANLFGIDADAKVETPNGEQITLKNLRTKLKNEGMSQSEANKVIKALQQNLGISSNWLFGW